MCTICSISYVYRDFHFGVINRTPEDQSVIEAAKMLPSGAAYEDNPGATGEENSQDLGALCGQGTQEDPRQLRTRGDSSSIAGSILSRASEHTLRSIEVDLGRC